MIKYNSIPTKILLNYIFEVLLQSFLMFDEIDLFLRPVSFD